MSKPIDGCWTVLGWRQGCSRSLRGDDTYEMYSFPAAFLVSSHKLPGIRQHGYILSYSGDQTSKLSVSRAGVKVWAGLVPLEVLGDDSFLASVSPSCLNASAHGPASPTHPPWPFVASNTGNIN